MATKKKSLPRKQSSAKRSARRRASTVTVVEVAKPRKRVSKPTKRASKPTKRARRIGRKVATTVRKTYRKARGAVSRAASGVIVSDKKTTALNLAALVGGFFLTMLVANVAPIPAAFKPKWKGAVLAVLGVAGALKIKDKRFQLGFTGLALYGLVDLGRSYIPGLAALGAIDNRAALLGMSRPQSVARRQIGNAYSQSAAQIGNAHNMSSQAIGTRAVPVRASVVPASAFSGTAGYASAY